MANDREKLEHILAYAKQQKALGAMHCHIPPSDMVDIMEQMLTQNSTPMENVKSEPKQQGWILMPDELTLEMHSAAWDAYHESGVMSDIYKAMLESAGSADNDASKIISEMTMLIKRLAYSLHRARPDSKLPSEAKAYLKNRGLVSVEDILR